MFEVFREDGGPVPILTANHFGDAPREIVDRFARAAVEDLTENVLGSQRTDFLVASVAEILAIAGRSVANWQGPEWPVTEDDNYKATAYVSPDYRRGRWLGCVSISPTINGSTSRPTRTTDISGWSCRSAASQSHKDYPPDHFRLHPHLDLPTGVVTSISVTLDNTVLDDPNQDDCVLTEVTLTIGKQTILLIAAEAYGPGEWHRYDESVVVLRDATTVDQIARIPPRPMN